jgi:hypothetical protein
MDESCFARSGIINIHGERVWSESWYSLISPTVVTVFHPPMGSNFRWLGPHMLPAWVSGCSYLNFVQSHLSGLLEDVSFNAYFHMWFQHNGASPHYSYEVCLWLSKNYPSCWIGCRCEVPVSWLASSPDLNPLQFFLCRYLKFKFCASQLILERNYVIRSNICKWNKEYALNLQMLESLFIMQSWFVCPWTCRQFRAPPVRK